MEATMKRWRRTAGITLAMGLALAALAGCGSDDESPSDTGSNDEPTALRMQLSWVPSAQFAGYLVARDKGFYEDANLDVTVLPGGPNVNNIQQLVAGEADLAVDRVSTLFQSRDKGMPLKGIAEFDQESGFWLVAKKSNGILEPEDLVGQKVGIFSDNEFEYLAMLEEMGVDPDSVKTFYQGFTKEPFLNDEYPVAQVTSWDQLQVILASGYSEDDLTFFKPTDYGVGVLHGALIVTESILDENPEALTAFVQATMEGWKYAFENPEEALDIVGQESQDASRTHEAASLDEMKNILWGRGADSPPEGWGTIPVDVWEQTAQILMDGDYVDNPIDVPASMDTSIAPQDE